MGFYDYIVDLKQKRVAREQENALNYQARLDAQQRQELDARQGNSQMAADKLMDLDGELNPYLVQLQKDGASQSKIDFLRNNQYATKDDLMGAIQEADQFSRQKNMIDAYKGRIDQRYGYISDDIAQRAALRPPPGAGLRGGSGMRGMNAGPALQKRIFDMAAADPQFGAIDEDSRRSLSASAAAGARSMMDNSYRLGQPMTEEEAIDAALENERQNITPPHQRSILGIPLGTDPGKYQRMRGPQPQQAPQQPMQQPQQSQQTPGGYGQGAMGGGQQQPGSMGGGIGQDPPDLQQLIQSYSAKGISPDAVRQRYWQMKNGQ